MENAQIQLSKTVKRNERVSHVRVHVHVRVRVCATHT